MPCRRFFSVLILCLCFGFLGAQNTRNNWVDSVYLLLEDDADQDFPVVRQYGDSLIQIFLNRNEPCREIHTRLRLSSYYIRSNRIKLALRNIYLANQQYLRNPCIELPVMPEICLSYAYLYRHLGELKKVKYYTEKGINSWNPAWKNSEPLMLLHLMSGYLKNDLEDELVAYKIALDMAMRDGNSRLKEMALNNIGSAYAMADDYRKAEIYLRQALTIAFHRKGYATLSIMYNNLAGLSRNPYRTEMYIDSAIYYANISGNWEDKLTAWQNKALFLYQRGNYQLGYDHLWESVVIRDSLYNEQKVKAFAEMEQRFEAEKKDMAIGVLQSENEISRLKESKNRGIMYGMGGALVAILFVAYAFYIQKQRKDKLNVDLQKEKKKSDDLLLNILPEEVASELKSAGRSEARLYQQVSVLFTDFVNFTGISEKLSPKELVEEIHRNFTAIDQIIENNGLEKIKTIGDAYLAVCGLPHENPKHARQAVQAAIEIRDYMNNNEGKFQIRIGIHSGPVVAGIVGVKKYAYDIWGDTVNMAARMEQSSEAGKINISGATFELLVNEFDCEYRGKINAKNKGEVDMYFVKVKN